MLWGAADGAVAVTMTRKWMRGDHPAKRITLSEKQGPLGERPFS